MRTGSRIFDAAEAIVEPEAARPFSERFGEGVALTLIFVFVVIRRSNPKSLLPVRLSIPFRL